MGQNATEFATPVIANASTSRHGVGFIFPAPKSIGANRDPLQWFLLCLVFLLGSTLIWTCWDFFQSWKTYSSPIILGMFGLFVFSVAALGVAGGAALRSRNTASDSMQLVELNERLLKERDLLRTIIDALPDYIYAKDREGRFLLNNPAHARSFGATPEQLRGKTDFDFFPHELAEQYFADEQRIISTGESVINQEQCKPRRNDPAGEKKWSLCSKVVWRDHHGEVLGTVGVTRDIHEFKRTQEALHQSEQRLREVMRRTRCILNFGEVTGPDGWREHALETQSPFEWNFPVQNLEGAQELCPLDVPGGKTYQQVWTESRHREDIARMNQVSGNALLNDLPYFRYEFRCRDKNGVEHWMQKMVTIQKLAESRWQIFGITTEITDLKNTEEALRASEEKLKRFTAQLEQSNRELQDFAYVASHDLQEPLRKIVVFSERLKEKAGESLAAEPRDYVDRMQKAASRMQTLINDLLSFSRVTTKAHPFVSVNLGEIAQGVLEDLESRIEQVKGRVEVGILPVFDADGLQMRQLLQNLIGNALKFHKAGTPPVIKVEGRKFFNQAGREICELTVADNCIGFDEKYLDRIFNVFQRLHSRNEYEGTGMGLAIVRKIALHHNGNVTARSRPGEGSTFIVTLPAAHTRGAAFEPTKNHEN